MKTQRNNWLAIAREAIIRAGYSPSEADSTIGDLCGDFRDTLDNQDWAFEVCAQVQFTNSRELEARHE